MMQPTFNKKLLILFGVTLSCVVFFYYYQNSWIDSSEIISKNNGNSTFFNTQTTSKIKPVFNQNLNAEIALIGNIETGHIFYEKSSDTEALIASITKLLSATVVLSKMDLDSVVTINQSIYNKLPSKNDLVLNEQIKVYDLLRMALVMSSNDAISALAYHYGYDGFVEVMNQKALEIGMFHSHFSNAVGFDSDQNYSSALDLFYLSRYIYNNHAIIGEISKSKAFNFKSVSGVKHLVIPTNTIIDQIPEF